MERLNPLNDYLFFKMMGEKGDEVQLLAFLNAVLGRSGDRALASVEIAGNRILSPEITGNKGSVLDVRGRTAGGTRINIEVQIRNPGNTGRRSLFYLEPGQDYRELPNVVAINIIDWKEALEIHFVDMVKFRRVREKDIRMDAAIRKAEERIAVCAGGSGCVP